MKTKMRGADRLWAAAGAVVALALTALTYLFLISPQYAETDGLQDQVDQVNVDIARLQTRLIQQRKDNEKLDEYKAGLDARRQALPTATALSDFLRQMQAAGERTGVSVTTVNAGAAGTTHAAGASIKVLPVTLTVAGGVDGQIAFLDQLQQAVPRAVLIIGANLVPGDNSISLAGSVTMSLSVQIFMAAPSETPATQPSASNPTG